MSLAELIPAHRAEAARRVAERLAGATSVAVATHVNGDGDGWGSACGLAHHLLPTGVEVTLLAATPYPDRYRFLLPAGLEPLGPGSEGKGVLEAADVQLVVDTSEVGRLGDFAPIFDSGRTVIIDHHAVASTQLRATLSLVDSGAAATAELVYDVIAAGGERLSAETARALYVGIVTDTGSFRYSNSSPHVHRLAARFIETGVDPEALYGPLFASVTPAELATLEAALSKLERDEELGLTWSIIDVETTRRLGRIEDYDLVIEHLRNLEGTRIAVLFRELEDRSVKVSLRAVGPVDVARLAGEFGGGGHAKAAGARIEGALPAASGRVLEACREALREA